MPSPDLTAVVDGLGYPESPRWHDDRIWCTDFLSRTVRSFSSDGPGLVHGYLPGQPSGLGFGPDGEQLVVSVYDRKLIRLEDGSPRMAADLVPYSNCPLNDMAISPAGIAYVGVLGLETAYRPHTEIGSGRLVAVSPSGECRIVAADLGIPNGIAITSDGQSLVVAETCGRRLTSMGSLALSGTRTRFPRAQARIDSRYSRLFGSAIATCLVSAAWSTSHAASRPARA